MRQKTEAYSEPCQTSKNELFVKTEDILLTIFDYMVLNTRLEKSFCKVITKCDRSLFKVSKCVRYYNV